MTRRDNRLHKLSTSSAVPFFFPAYFNAVTKYTWHVFLVCTGAILV